jgi:transcription antitermination protein NusB
MQQSKRRQTREKVLQVLYAFEMTHDPIEKVKNDIFTGIKEADNLEFGNKLIQVTIENHNRFDDMIKVTVKNWEFERIAKIDQIIIRMCLGELFYFEEIPPKVSINEAIDLAKAFSTKNSGKFVNGVLDSIFIILKNSGDIKKTGKGLINTSKKITEETTN